MVFNRSGQTIHDWDGASVPEIGSIVFAAGK